MKLLLHELDKHCDRLQYLRRKKALMTELIRDRNTSAIERRDFEMWKGILEKLEVREKQVFKERVRV